jgi:hypothetical protein
MKERIGAIPRDLFMACVSGRVARGDTATQAYERTVQDFADGGFVEPAIQTASGRKVVARLDPTEVVLFHG